MIDMIKPVIIRRNDEINALGEKYYKEAKDYEKLHPEAPYKSDNRYFMHESAIECLLRCAYDIRRPDKQEDVNSGKDYIIRFMEQDAVLQIKTIQEEKRFNTGNISFSYAIGDKLQGFISNYIDKLAFIVFGRILGDNKYTFEGLMHVKVYAKCRQGSFYKDDGSGYVDRLKMRMSAEEAFDLYKSGKY